MAAPASAAGKPKFAPARIKKIMQADDDVGRVATTALPVVGRSLELFAAELVTKAAAIAEKDNDVRKTLSAAHIKKCVETDPLFDFLRATVQQVPIALPQKRARAPSDAGAPKRSKTADGVEGADGQGKGASGDGDGSVASQLAVASNYRPLADCDDDYDAEDDG